MAILISNEIAELANNQGYDFDKLFIPKDNKKFPTQSILHKWIRKNLYILIVINIDINGRYYFELFNIRSKRCSEIYGKWNNLDYSEYEEAFSEGLIAALNSPS